MPLYREAKSRQKKLKRYIVHSETTSLEAKSSELTVLIGDILCKLDLKYTLYLLDRYIRLHIYIARNYFLNSSLVTSYSFLYSSITNIYINRGDYINNNLILILMFQMSINLLRAVLISTSILGIFQVLIQSFKAKFILYRDITNNLKKIIKRKKVIIFIQELIELIERGHISS